VNLHLAESITKKFEASAGSCEASFYALIAFLWSFFRPQTPTGWVGTIHLSGSDQPTPDPNFSHLDHPHGPVITGQGHTLGYREKKMPPGKVYVSHVYHRIHILV